MQDQLSLSFCPELDSFGVELGCDIQDAFNAQTSSAHACSSSLEMIQYPSPPKRQAAEIKAEIPLQVQMEIPTPRDLSDVMKTNMDDEEVHPDDDDEKDIGLGQGEQREEVDAMNMTETQTGRWTKREHELFLKGMRLYGKSWKNISNLVATRTLVQIRTHAQKYLQKQNKARTKHFTLSNHPTAAYLMNQHMLHHHHRQHHHSSMYHQQHCHLSNSIPPHVPMQAQPQKVVYHNYAETENENGVDQWLHDDDSDSETEKNDMAISPLGINTKNGEISKQQCCLVVNKKTHGPAENSSPSTSVPLLKNLAPSHLAKLKCHQLDTVLPMAFIEPSKLLNYPLANNTLIRHTSHNMPVPRNHPVLPISTAPLALQIHRQLHGLP
jgi:SHAQKYF class myb-like DNA-binding protein